TVKEGENVSFTITPDAGYRIYKVTLNDKDITDKVVDGRLAFAYDELDANSAIEIEYIAEAAAKRLEAKAEKGIESVDPVKVYVSVEDRYKIPIDSSFDDLGGNGNHTALIVGCVVAGVGVVGVCAALLTVYIVRKRRANAADKD
ncbi:MAG: hypothetical protein K2N82_03135, partial [Lachnospiraceae bacterium]|nr:hypothetical protein [Lachnospiraceae bacterium]